MSERVNVLCKFANFIATMFKNLTSQHWQILFETGCVINDPFVLSHIVFLLISLRLVGVRKKD